MDIEDFVDMLAINLRSLLHQLAQHLATRCNPLQADTRATSRSLNALGEQLDELLASLHCTLTCKDTSTAPSLAPPLPTPITSPTLPTCAAAVRVVDPSHATQMSHVCLRAMRFRMLCIRAVMQRVRDDSEQLAPAWVAQIAPRLETLLNIARDSLAFM